MYAIYIYMVTFTINLPAPWILWDISIRFIIAGFCEVSAAVGAARIYKAIQEKCLEDTLKVDSFQRRGQARESHGHHGKIMGDLPGL